MNPDGLIARRGAGVGGRRIGEREHRKNILYSY